MCYKTVRPLNFTNAINLHYCFQAWGEMAKFSVESEPNNVASKCGQNVCQVDRTSGHGIRRTVRDLKILNVKWRKRLHKDLSVQNFGRKTSYSVLLVAGEKSREMPILS